MRYHLKDLVMESSPKNLLDQTKPARRARRAWYFYDFGNSAYAAIVLLAVYSAYFKNAVVGGAEGTRLWGWSVGIAAVLVALMSPVLGSIADFSRPKTPALHLYPIADHLHRALVLVVRRRLIGCFSSSGGNWLRGAQVFYEALWWTSPLRDDWYISGKAGGWQAGVVACLLSYGAMQLIATVIPYF